MNSLSRNYSTVSDSYFKDQDIGIKSFGVVRGENAKYAGGINLEVATESVPITDLKLVLDTKDKFTKVVMDGSFMHP
jgi:hypothetical protein